MPRVPFGLQNTPGRFCRPATDRGSKGVAAPFIFLSFRGANCLREAFVRQEDLDPKRSCRPGPRPCLGKAEASSVGLGNIVSGDREIPC